MSDDEQTTAFNSGFDVIARINWCQWQINEAYRLNDLSEMFKQLKILFSELSPELDKKELDKYIERIKALNDMEKKYIEYEINYQNNSKYLNYNSPNNFKEELEMFTIELKRELKETGLGMPTKEEAGSYLDEM